MKKFCCMSLRTGGVVIGWLGAVGAFMASVVLIVLMRNPHQVEVRYYHMDTDSYEYRTDYSETIFRSCLMAVCLMTLATSILLIVGSMKNRHLLLIPWLVQGAFGLLFSTVKTLVSIFFAIHAPPIAAIIIILILSASLAFEIYIYLAIWALFSEISSKSREGHAIHPQQIQYYPSTAVVTQV